MIKMGKEKSKIIETIMISKSEIKNKRGYIVKTFDCEDGILFINFKEARKFINGVLTDVYRENKLVSDKK